MSPLSPTQGRREGTIQGVSPFSGNKHFPMSFTNTRLPWSCALAPGSGVWRDDCTDEACTVGSAISPEHRY
jgi:hypothetical protein